MNCGHAEGILGAWIDGELPAGEEREVSEHVAGCAACAAEAEAIRRIAGSARDWFRRSASELPDLRESQDRFVRRSLSSGALDVRPRWWRSPAIIRSAAAGILILAAAGVLFFTGGDEVRAGTYLRDAVESTFAGAGCLRIRVDRPALLAPGRRPSVIVLGPGNRFLVESEDVALMPPGFVVAGEIRRVWRAPGKLIWFGSDGATAWVHVQGEQEVRLLDVPPMPVARMFRKTLEEEPGERAGLALFNWARVQDLLERSRSGTVAYETGEPLVAGGETLRPVRVVIGSGDAAAAARILVRDQDLAIRRIEFGFFTFTFDKPGNPPADSAFHWSSVAPPDVRILDLR